MGFGVAAPVARAGCLLLVCGLVAGCGEDAEDRPPIDSDPVAVSRAFLTAVARGDTAACPYMTANAINQFEVVSGEAGCDDAVKAHREVLAVDDYVVRRKELLGALDNGELSDSGTGFRVSLPRKAELSLRLRDSDKGWEVDGLLLGQTVVCRAGDEIGAGPGC